MFRPSRSSAVASLSEGMLQKYMSMLPLRTSSKAVFSSKYCMKRTSSKPVSAYAVPAASDARSVARTT